MVGAIQDPRSLEIINLLVDYFVENGFVLFKHVQETDDLGCPGSANLGEIEAGTVRCRLGVLFKRGTK